MLIQEISELIYMGIGAWVPGAALRHFGRVLLQMLINPVELLLKVYKLMIMVQFGSLQQKPE